MFPPGIVPLIVVRTSAPFRVFALERGLRGGE